jgi:hypothetical protein
MSLIDFVIEISAGRVEISEYDRANAVFGNRPTEEYFRVHPIGLPAVYHTGLPCTDNDVEWGTRC